jgi:hypothetical protein
MRLKAFAVPVLALAAPASAGAVTLIGSGGSVRQRLPMPASARGKRVRTQPPFVRWWPRRAVDERGRVTR